MKLKKLKNVFSKRKSIDEKIIEKNLSQSTNQSTKEQKHHNDGFVGIMIDDDYDLSKKIDISKEISHKLGNGVYFEDNGVRICINEDADKQEVINSYNNIQLMMNTKRMYKDIVDSIENDKDRIVVERTKASMAFELVKIFLHQEADKDKYSQKKSHSEIVIDSCKLVDMVFARFDVDGKINKELQDMLNKELQ